MNTDTATDKARAIRDYCRQTIGSQTFYQHWLKRTVYTEGVNYLASTCGAFWLIDAIDSHQPAIRRKAPEFWRFQAWRLEAPQGERPWVLTAWSDTPGKSSLLARQDIEFSDFPEELCPWELWYVDGVLMLREEY